jgi:hypothetical protein
VVQSPSQWHFVASLGSSFASFGVITLNKKSFLVLVYLPILLTNIQNHIAFSRNTNSGEIRVNVKEDDSLLKRKDFPVEESDTEKMLWACNNNIDSNGQIILLENASPECTQLFNGTEKALNNSY